MDMDAVLQAVQENAPPAQQANGFDAVKFLGVLNDIQRQQLKNALVPPVDTTAQPTQPQAGQQAQPVPNAPSPVITDPQGTTHVMPPGAAAAPKTISQMTGDEFVALMRSTQTAPAPGLAPAGAPANGASNTSLNNESIEALAAAGNWDAIYQLGASGALDAYIK